MMSITTPLPPPDTLELDTGPVNALDLALFAAASGDHNPLHLDADVARQAGFEQPLVHGMLSMAHAGRIFTRHFGAGSLLRLQTRFTGSAGKGDTLHITARLQEVCSDHLCYCIEGTVQDGAPLLTGEALVRRPVPN